MNLGRKIEKYRVVTGDFRSELGDFHGAFDIPYKSNSLLVISSGHTDPKWQHVSVSLKKRCPNWEEMQFIKELFWDSKELVVQFHPPNHDYINIMDYCLHLWKNNVQKIELPPNYMV